MRLDEAQPHSGGSPTLRSRENDLQPADYSAAELSFKIILFATFIARRFAK
jgi:hypothetical protein